MKNYLRDQFDNFYIYHGNTKGFTTIEKGDVEGIITTKYVDKITLVTNYVQLVDQYGTVYSYSNYNKKYQSTQCDSISITTTPIDVFIPNQTNLEDFIL